MLPKPVLTFDWAGKLERVHFQAGCNLDDSKDKREVTWAEALIAVYRWAEFEAELLAPDVAIDLFVERALCGYCFSGGEP